MNLGPKTNEINKAVRVAKIDLKEAPTADKCKIFKPEDFEELDTMAGRERIVQRTMSFVSEALFDSEDES